MPRRRAGRHDIAVVALGQGEEDVGALDAGPAQDVLVRAVAADGGPAEGRWQALEGARRDVQHDDLVSGRVPQLRGGCADSPAAHDHDLHRFPRSSARAPPIRCRARSGGCRGSSGRWRTPRRNACDMAAGDQQVRAALGRLVDDRRGDVAGLQQHRSSGTLNASAISSAESRTRWTSSERPAMSASSGRVQSISTTWTAISSALVLAPSWPPAGRSARRWGRH